MSAKLFPSHHLLLYSIIFILFTLPTYYAKDDERYYECATLYSCGQNIREIGYPFSWDNRSKICGLEGFELQCHNNDYTTIEINSQTFRVLSIDQSLRSNSITIARNDIWNNICVDKFSDTELNESQFGYMKDVQFVTLFYDCAPRVNNIPTPNTFVCPINGIDRSGFLVEETISLVDPCPINMRVPVLETALQEFMNDASSLTVGELLNRGFNVEYKINSSACLECVRSGGLCWSKTNSTPPICLCRDGEKSDACPPKPAGNNFNWKLKTTIGFSAAGISILFMSLIFFFYHRRNRKRYVASSLFSRNISSYPSSMSGLEKAGTYHGVHIFTYSELEKATNNFDSKRELGDGGFGAVYQGKLRDGRIVAVKRLFENNYKRVEQFMNEVDILARLRHQNLVSLYGCTSHRCRELLLVYEYVPNGTVADHLHGERAKPGSVTWSTRMNIAIETASALAYLHASDVIHRDVKTNNILLDNSFSVKVADFGLSRLFPTNVTHVSTAPQGTPGYVDPEYHECYHLTDKSDVFSFGVVLIELISSKPAVDITRHRHEINLSNMAINKITNHALHELVDPCVGFESDYKVRKMIKAVAELAFQCLQNGREMRPSMVEVLEDLKAIQSKDYNRVKEEEVDILADDVVLLKNIPQPLSPDSVTVKWVSNSTSYNSSG